MPTASASTRREMRSDDFDRDFGRDPAAERDPREGHVTQVEGFHQVEIEIGEIVDGGEVARQVALAESRMRGGEHRKTLREFVEHAVRRLEPDGGVQEQEWPALAAPDQFEPHACDFRQSIFGFHAVEHAGITSLAILHFGLMPAASTSSRFCLIWARKNASNSAWVMSNGSPPSATSLSCTFLTCRALAVSR